MDEQKFKNTVAENIAHYRKAAGLTQGALAAKINYTDKSVSKWERGDGLPDVFVIPNPPSVSVFVYKSFV